MTGEEPGEEVRRRLCARTGEKPPVEKLEEIWRCGGRAIQHAGASSTERIPASTSIPGGVPAVFNSLRRRVYAEDYEITFDSYYESEGNAVVKEENLKKVAGDLARAHSGQLRGEKVSRGVRAQMRWPPPPSRRTSTTSPGGAEAARLEIASWLPKPRWRRSSRRPRWRPSTSCSTRNTRDQGRQEVPGCARNCVAACWASCAKHRKGREARAGDAQHGHDHRVRRLAQLRRLPAGGHLVRAGFSLGVTEVRGAASRETRTRSTSRRGLAAGSTCTTRLTPFAASTRSSTITSHSRAGRWRT